MFHPDPEKWVTGAYIKIGYFGDSDLRYQDEVHGPLILQADKVVELIYTKYMKALIDYKGLQRTETYMFPMVGFREILLNAINHKDYSTGIPIQISIYEDKIYVWNDGKWPDKLNDAEACMLRELYEELHLTFEDIENTALRYVTLRRTKEEIRQNYYFFANLKEHVDDNLASNEGICKWFSLNEICGYFRNRWGKILGFAVYRR